MGKRYSIPHTDYRLPDLRQRNRALLLLEADDRELRGELLGGGAERLRRGRLRFADANRDAGVAADADRLVDRDVAEERHVHVPGERLAAPLAEDVALGAAGRADEVAHVLDQAERRHVQ